MNPDLERRIEAIEQKLAVFENAAQYSPDLQRSLSQALTSASSKASNSENVSIDEAGSSTVQALGEPTGFIKIGDKDVPYF